MIWKWPTDLQLGFDRDEIRTLNIQSQICKNRSPMARIMCVPGNGSHDFDELVKSLRNRSGVSSGESDSLSIHLLTPWDRPRLLAATLRASTRRNFASRRFSRTCYAWSRASRRHRCVTRVGRTAQSARWSRALGDRRDQCHFPFPWPCH